MAYQYYRTITIDKDQVSGTNADFPVWIDVTADELKTTGNGGNVTDANGYDLIVSADASSDGSGIVAFERVSYSASTGQFQAHAKVASVGDVSDTVIYLLYGDSGVTTDQQDINNTWNSDYAMVLHLDESAGLPQDSTSNANHVATDYGSTTSVTGQVGNARNFNGINHSLEVSDSASLQITSNITVQMWFRPDGGFISGGANEGLLYKQEFQHFTTLTAKVYDMGLIGSTGKNIFVVSDGVGFGLVDTTQTVWNDQWYMIHATWDGTTGANGMKWYIDGAVENQATSPVSSMQATAFNLMIGGRNQVGGAPYWFDGKIDEVRVLATDLSAGWILTEYNNQNDPGTFYALGSEVEITPAPTIVQQSKTLRAIKLEFYRSALSSASTSMEDLEREWMISEGASGQSLVDLRVSFLELQLGYLLPNEWTMWTKFLDAEGVPDWTSQIDRLKYWYAVSGGATPPGGAGDQLVLQVGGDVLNIQIDDSLLLQTS